MYNRLPRADGLPSPYESAHGSPPSLRMIHPFGSLVMSKVHNERKSLLTTSSRPAVLLGPAEGTKDAFKIIHMDTKTVAHSRNLVHFDNDFPYNKPDVPSVSALVPPSLLAPPPAAQAGSQLPPELLSDHPFSALTDPPAARPRRVAAQSAPMYVPGAFEAQRACTRPRPPY